MTSCIFLYTQKYRTVIFFAFACVLVASCANMASPSGGDYDFDPPVVLESVPDFNAVRVTDNKIQLTFNELVQIENPNEKVIVTPPQKKLPKIQAISNRVIVELRDTLLPNTTYTIDFTDAIADNNEKNTLENFSISFSTGDEVDSLAISGKVLTAENLEPVKGIYVGLHSDLSDSAFVKKVFDRISRTNDKGEFTIKGVKEGKYRLYALDDPNRSFKYENTSNAIAFLDSLIVPGHTQAVRPDTLFNRDMTIDTIFQKPYTRFLPDNILLRTFVSAFQRQYLQKHERPAGNELRIYFGGGTPMPEVKPLNFDGSKDWYVLEHSLKNDSLKYWLTDTLLVKMDTLVLQLNYQITDSLNNPVAATDTLNFISRKVRQQSKDKTDDSHVLPLASNLKSAVNVYENILLKFGQPVSDFDESKFVLQRLVDTVYVDEKISVMQDSLNPLRYIIKHKWRPAQEYRFRVDSAVFHSYTGLVNNPLNMLFKIRSLEEYGNLVIHLQGLDRNHPAFVELLSPSDVPVRKVKVVVKDGEAGVVFMNLDPGKYYVRLVVDANDNGKWDTGDYFKKLQPEEVYYCSKLFEIKEYFVHEEEWDVGAVEPVKQKPLEITKNKPQEKKTRREQLEQQENKNKQQQRTNNPNMPIGGGQPAGMR